MRTTRRLELDDDVDESGTRAAVVVVVVVAPDWLSVAAPTPTPDQRAQQEHEERDEPGARCAHAWAMSMNARSSRGTSAPIGA